MSTTSQRARGSGCTNKLLNGMDFFMFKTKSIALVFSFLFSASAFAEQIKIDDYVVENYAATSIQKVVDISRDGLYQLEDGQWYQPQYIRSLIPKYGNISVGQSVVEGYEATSIKKVLNISSDGLYQLEDGQWYQPQYIRGYTIKKGIPPR